MLPAYAAWAEGAVETDLDAIRSAMGFRTALIQRIRAMTAPIRITLQHRAKHAEI
jgi:hypothetical protein